MSSLRGELIRLAYDHPEVRPHILPLLKSEGKYPVDKSARRIPMSVDKAQPALKQILVEIRKVRDTSDQHLQDIRAEMGVLRAEEQEQGSVVAVLDRLLTTPPSKWKDPEIRRLKSLLYTADFDRLKSALAVLYDMYI